jgi:hypothetical protein
MAAVAALAFLVACRGRGGALLGVAGVVGLVVALLAIVAFVAPYVYEDPRHHCPFCILKAEYSYRGYLLYVPLFGATAAALGALALQPFSGRAFVAGQVERATRTLATVSGTLFVAFALSPPGHRGFAGADGWRVLIADRSCGRGGRGRPARLRRSETRSRDLAPRLPPRRRARHRLPARGRGHAHGDPLLGGLVSILLPGNEGPRTGGGTAEIRALHRAGGQRRAGPRHDAGVRRQAGHQLPGARRRVRRDGQGLWRHGAADDVRSAATAASATSWSARDARTFERLARELLDAEQPAPATATTAPLDFGLAFAAGVLGSGHCWHAARVRCFMRLAPRPAGR